MSIDEILANFVNHSEYDMITIDHFDVTRAKAALLDLIHQRETAARIDELNWAKDNVFYDDEGDIDYENIYARIFQLEHLTPPADDYEGLSDRVGW
jgi:hypothetical protein